jgi:hypothetical protein
MNEPTCFPRRRLLLALVAAVAFAGCDRQDPLPTGLLPAPDAPVELSLRVSDGRTPAGGSLVVALLVDSADGGRRPAGLQGALRWDPAQLEYAGQVVDPQVLVFAGEPDARAGRLRFLAVHPERLPERAAVFAFRVRQAAVSPRLAFEPEVAVDPAGEMEHRVAAGVGVDASLPDPRRARVMDRAAWGELLAPDEGGPARVPGAAVRFGDGDQSGSINVFDVLYTAQASVNTQPCILDTDQPAPGRDCLAVDVRPANLPGLGEASDDCPPGVQVCADALTDPLRIINVFDVLAIQRSNVGIAEPVVGDLIPSVTATDTVLLSGTILGPRTLSADTVYRLSGLLSVGQDSGSSAATLFIEAGTRLEAVDAGSGLVVRRTGRVVARGTRYQPITFTCAGSPAPGCWRGLLLHGSARINQGTASSPAIPGRAGAGGCNERVVGEGAYGGCEDTDSSGVLRWVRVENAGNGGAALQLRGVGDGTVLEQLYVLASAGTGVEVEGGTARLRRARLIAPGTRGLAWTEGWRGKLQWMLVQTESGSTALEGRNAAGDPFASPRSAPELHNVTVVGPPDPGGPGAAEGIAGVHLLDGTDATLGSFLFYARPYPFHRVLDIDGVPTWSRFAAGAIRVEESLFVGFGRLGDGDDDFVGGVPYVSPGVEDQYLRDTATNGNRIFTDFGLADSLLTGPFARVPDFRARVERLALLDGCPGPVPGPFFQAAPYCGAGAEEPDEFPWWEPAPLRSMTGVPLGEEPAFFTLTLLSAEDSIPLPGVRVNGVPAGGTDPAGRYRSYTDPTGVVLSYSIPDSLDNALNLCPPSTDIITSGFAPRTDVAVTVLIPECGSP